MSGWLRGRCRRVLTTAGAELAPGLERRRRQLVLVLDSGVCGRTLPVLVVLQGPVVATLGAFYDARAGSRALQGSGKSCYFLRRSHDDHTRKHDEHSLVQGHTLVQCLVVAILDLLCGCKHEDHALVVEASLGKANAAKVAQWVAEAQRQLGVSLRNRDRCSRAGATRCRGRCLTSRLAGDDG